MNDEAEVNPGRPGSSADLSRRMDRMERRQDSTDIKVTDLAAVVARVEVNQSHAIELNQLRFTSVDTSLKALASEVSQMRTDFAGFINRVNNLISGETTTAQGQRMLKEYEDFKADTSRRLDAQDVLNGQIKLLGRIAVILVSTNVVGVAVAIAALLKGPQ